MEKLKLKIIDFFGMIAIRLIMDFEEIVDLFKTVITTFVLCLIITNFFFMPVIVEGMSMNPTLTDGSTGFANIIATKVTEFKRFDIVVIKKSDNNQIVKRIIGLPGETIWYQDDTLYVNGQPIEEDFLDKEYMKDYLENSSRENFTTDFAPITLGEDEYYCLGDNRPVSLDSRALGAFKKSQIVADGVWIIIRK